MTAKKNKKNIRPAIREYLMQQEEVVFAWLFGSFVNNKTWRDIDVAIYTRNKPELIRLGTMQTELSGLTGHEVDLIHLNNLAKKNPAFAYEIVTRGELLFSDDPQLHRQYKQNVLLYYFDTAYLRERVDQAFTGRLESKKFGQRNYE